MKYIYAKMKVKIRRQVGYFFYLKRAKRVHLALLEHGERVIGKDRFVANCIRLSVWASSVYKRGRSRLCEVRRRQDVKRNSDHVIVEGRLREK